VETLPDKVLTTPSVTNLGSVSVMAWAKRRKLDMLNRRSQKKSYTWESYNAMMKAHPLATPKIYVSVYER